MARTLRCSGLDKALSAALASWRAPRAVHWRVPPVTESTWTTTKGSPHFGEATIASAMIDRIVHHADVIALKGASYRIKHTAIESLPP